jgi:hypothetical protein
VRAARFSRTALTWSLLARRTLRRALPRWSLRPCGLPRVGRGPRGICRFYADFFARAPPFARPNPAPMPPFFTMAASLLVLDAAHRSPARQPMGTAGSRAFAGGPNRTTRRSGVLCRKSGAREEFRSTFAAHPPAFAERPAMPPCQDPYHAVGLGRRDICIQDTFRWLGNRAHTRGLLALPLTFARAHLRLFARRPALPFRRRGRLICRAISIVLANLAVHRGDEAVRFEPPSATDAPTRAPNGSRDSRASRLSPGRPRHESRRTRFASRRRSALRRSDPRWQGRWTRPSSFGLFEQRGHRHRAVPLSTAFSARGEVHERPLTPPVTPRASP